MKKKISLLFFMISIFMIFAFIVLLLVDYSNFDPIVTSAPFYADVLIRAVELVLPAFVFACIGYIYKKEH